MAIATHGHARHSGGERQSRTYKTWDSMLQRCFNPKHKSYKNYGGRGLTVCSRWLKFDNFLADMGERPNGTTIERLNNEIGYEPGNCKWSSLVEQCRNRRSTRNITAFGRTQCLEAWATERGLNHQTIARKLDRGYSPEAALQKSRKRNKCVS